MLPSGMESFYQTERERVTGEELPEWIRNLMRQQQKMGILTSPVAMRGQAELQKGAMGGLAQLRGKLGMTWEEWKEQRERAEKQRGFVSGESAKQRGFASSEAALARRAAKEEAEKQRIWQEALTRAGWERQETLAKAERKRQRKAGILSTVLGIGGGLLTGGLMPGLFGAGTGILGGMAKGGLMGMGGMGQLLGQQMGEQMQMRNLMNMYSQMPGMFGMNQSLTPQFTGRFSEQDFMDLMRQTGT